MELQDIDREEMCDKNDDDEEKNGDPRADDNKLSKGYMMYEFFFKEQLSNGRDRPDDRAHKKDVY